MSRPNEIECLERIKKGIAARSLKSNIDGSFLKEMLKSISASKETNKFPDFFFDGGVAEHFIITGSKDHGKGCDFKINESKAKRQTKEFFEKCDDEFLKSPIQPWTISTVSTENIYDESSYENFVYSFKKHFDDHLISLRKSNYVNNVVVFIIEQQDGRMGIYENNIFNRFYLLSNDKKMLQYIKSSYPNVNYVIFTCSDAIEAIDVSKIDVLIEKASEGLDIRGGRHITISLKNYIDIN